MKVRLFICCLILGLCASAQTITPNLGLIEPVPGSLNWAGALNGNFTILDNLAGGTVPAPSMVIKILKLGTAALTVNDPATGNLLSSTLEGTIPAALIPDPGSATLGGVKAGSCPGSAINAINTDGSTSCAASSSGGNGGLNNQTVGNVVSGTGAYDTKYTYTLGAALLSTVGGFDVFCGIVTSAQTSTVKMTFGGQDMPVGGIAVTKIGPITMKAHVYNQGATNSQWYVLDFFAVNSSDGTTQQWSYTANNLAVNTTSAQPITCQIQQSSMGQNSPNGFYVERVQQ